MFCSKCGSQLDDEALICPHCGCKTINFNNEVSPQITAPQVESKTGKVLGILSIVFGALGGWLGLVLGIIGICSSKTKQEKNLNIIGMSLFGVWIVIIILIACLV